MIWRVTVYLMFFRILPSLTLLLLSSLSAFGDCKETPLTYEKLMEVAVRPEVKDIETFLQNLPVGSLSNVTFVYDSNGTKEEKEAINAYFPGVVRTTADGKLSIRYECQGDGRTKEVKIIRFDEKNGTNEFKTAVVRFNDGIPAAHRVFENPASCKTCHQNLNQDLPMLKPIWQSYPHWKGFYGSQDDNLYDTSNPNSEAANFQEFLRQRKENPCYQLSLPAVGPYFTKQTQPKEADANQSNDNRFRTNLRITTNFGLLYAKALAKNLTRSPLWSTDLPEILQSVFSCREHEEFSRDNFDSKTWDSNYPSSGINRNFYELLVKLGAKKTDFNLGLHSDPGHYDDTAQTPRAFDVAAYAEEDGPLHELNFLALLREQMAELLKKLVPEINGTYTSSRGTEEHYIYSDNSCTDDIGGRLVFAAGARENLCKLLKIRFPLEQANTSAPVNTAVPDQASKLAKIYSTPDAKRALGILFETCRGCHSQETDSAYNFFKDEKTFTQLLATDRTFTANLIDRITSPDEPMPPKQDNNHYRPGHEIWPTLEDGNRTLVLNFLKRI